MDEAFGRDCYVGHLTFAAPLSLLDRTSEKEGWKLVIQYSL